MFSPNVLYGDPWMDRIFMRFFTLGDGLMWAWVVIGTHVLLVQYELNTSATRLLVLSAMSSYHDSYNRIMIGIVHVVG